MERQFTIGEESFFISDDKALLDRKAIHRFLSEESYWCEGIPLHTLNNAIDNSLCFGVYSNNQTIGFARIISDFATFA